MFGMTVQKVEDAKEVNREHELRDQFLAESLHLVDELLRSLGYEKILLG